MPKFVTLFLTFYFLWINYDNISQYNDNEFLKSTAYTGSRATDWNSFNFLLIVYRGQTKLSKKQKGIYQSIVPPRAPWCKNLVIESFPSIYLSHCLKNSLWVNISKTFSNDISSGTKHWFKRQNKKVITIFPRIMPVEQKVIENFLKHIKLKLGWCFKNTID